MPYSEAPDKLALTLAGLEGQSNPRRLFEVVSVDDGSEPPLETPSTLIGARVVHEENRLRPGPRRNNGARAVKHPVVVFLDGDMIPEAGRLAAHARWHHAVSDAMTLGFYARVSADGIDARAIRERPESLREMFAGRGFDPRGQSATCCAPAISRRATTICSGR